MYEEADEEMAAAKEAAIQLAEHPERSGAEMCIIPVTAVTGRFEVQVKRVLEYPGNVEDDNG